MQNESRSWCLGDITFRLARLEDVPELGTLYTQLIPEVKTESRNMAAGLAKILSNEDNEVIVGELAGKVVATCQIVIYENLIRAPGKKAIIDSVVVSENFRGCGIGTRMMKWAIERLAKKRCGHIGVGTRYSRTVAHRLYKKLQFEEFGFFFLFRVAP